MSTIGSTRCSCCVSRGSAVSARCKNKSRAENVRASSMLAGISAGSASEGNRYCASPGTPSGCLLVARTVIAGHDARSACVAAATPAATCSQLSSTSSVSRPASSRATSSIESTRSVRGGANDAAIFAATNSPFASGERSTKQTSRGSDRSRRLAISSAARVFPTPPDPVTVTSRDPARSWATVLMSSDRPTKDVRGCGRMSGTSASSAALGCCRARPRAAASSKLARSRVSSPSASANKETVMRYGARRVPRSSAPTALALIRAFSARYSCEKPARTRCSRSKFPKLPRRFGTPAGSATPGCPLSPTVRLTVQSVAVGPNGGPVPSGHDGAGSQNQSPFARGDRR